MCQCHTAKQRLKPKYASYGIRSCITVSYQLGRCALHAPLEKYRCCPYVSQEGTKKC
jgi:hypothetical protein